jgi:hypothetical protein
MFYTYSQSVTSTTSLWISLAIAALGIAGALSGVVLTQRQANRRDALAWKREEQSRTFEQRRDAYLSYYEATRALFLKVYEHGGGSSENPGNPEVPDDFAQPVYFMLTQLQIYGSPAVFSAARTVYEKLDAWGKSTSYGNVDDAFYQGQYHLQRG